MFHAEMLGLAGGPYRQALVRKWGTAGALVVKPELELGLDVGGSTALSAVLRAAPQTLPAWATLPASMWHRD